MYFLKDPTEVCNNLSVADYMVPEIIAIFVALLIHIALYFLLLIIIDVKYSGGSARDAFSCLKVLKKFFFFYYFTFNKYLFFFIET